MNKIFALLLPALLSGPLLSGQSASLKACHEAARAHHPVEQMPDLLYQLQALQTEQINSDRKPTVQWITKGTLQSENISLALPIPNFEAVDLPLYNLQSYLEGNYLILDGGLTDARKQLLNDQIAVQQQEVEQQLFPLYQAVNQYYFTVLRLQEQSEQVAVVRDNLNLQLEKMEGAYEQGVLLESDLKKVQLELLKLEQSIAQIAYQKEGALNGLALLTGLSVDTMQELAIPVPPTTATAPSNARPEYRLFELQKQQAFGKIQLTEAQSKPKLSVFLRAGVGYPNPLNFFDVSLSPYAIGGVQFQWPILNWGSLDRQRQIAQVQSNMVDIQAEAFTQQLDVQTERYRTQQRMLVDLIERDQAQLELQASILPQIQAQLDNETITVNDYLLQVNSELLIKLQLKSHELQLIQAQVEYATELGILQQ
ncbi:MAG: TolC family protein [Phaeodactylibacter sp.]|nr:TolC family protein [Phaeodactylibacter sp.]